MKAYILDEICPTNDKEINAKAKIELNKREKKFFQSLKKKNEKKVNIIDKNEEDIKYYPIKTLFYGHLFFSLWMKYAKKIKLEKNKRISTSKENDDSLNILPRNNSNNNGVSVKFFKFNNFELHDPKKMIQSVIIEQQEEELEERKPSISKNDKFTQPKRMTTAKIFPKLFKKFTN